MHVAMPAALCRVCGPHHPALPHCFPAEPAACQPHLACRVRFATGPLPGTPDGHPPHEGLTAQQRRVLSMALTPDLTPSNVRLLEQELGEDCQPSVTRLKRRWASPAGALNLLCDGRLDLAAAGAMLPVHRHSKHDPGGAGKERLTANSRPSPATVGRSPISDWRWAENKASKTGAGLHPKSAAWLR